MKKDIKTLLALAAVSLLSACSGGEEVYKGMKIDYQTFKGYVAELFKNDINGYYLQTNFSGEVVETTYAEYKDYENSTFTQSISYKFNYEKSQFYICNYVEDIKNDLVDVNNSSVSKSKTEMYIYLDQKEGLNKYYKEDPMIEGSDPITYKESIITVSEAFAFATSHDKSIMDVFNEFATQEIDYFFMISGFVESIYSVFPLYSVTYWSNVYNFLDCPEVVTKEDIYVDFEFDNFEFDFAGEDFATEDYCYNVKTSCKYKNRLLMNYDSSYNSKCLYDIDAETKTIKTDNHHLAIGNTYDSVEVTLPEECASYPVV